MPYIEAKTNISLDETLIRALKTSLTEALTASFPGKTENWLMLRFETDSTMFFAGTDAPCFLVDISIFGEQSRASYDAMTQTVCRLVEQQTGIPANRVYVKYSEYTHWGWNGQNF